MSQLHLLTCGFDVDRDNWLKATKRLKKQAESSKIFDTINTYTNQDCPESVKDFLENNKEFIKKYKRGCGWYFWKPFCINECLKNLPDNDYFIYADAGCEIYEYQKPEIVKSSIKKELDEKTIWFTTCNFNKKHTSLALFKMYNLPQEFGETKHCEATRFGIKITPETRKIIEYWATQFTDYEMYNYDIREPDDSEIYLAGRGDQTFLNITLYKLDYTNLSKYTSNLLCNVIDSRRSRGGISYRCSNLPECCCGTCYP
jgi:hypothetical protein